MSSKTDGHVQVQDKISRRKFMRSGAALVAGASAAVASTRQVLAVDCDRGGEGQNKPEHAGNGSDSDKGAGSDALGCGRQHQEKPKLSQSLPSYESDKLQPVKVKRIKA